MSIPAQKAMTAQKESSNPSSPQTVNPMNVCVLDDDAGSVCVLQKTIEQLGFVALGTSDPHDALDQIASGQCRVVLCDLKTPQMDGLTFLAQALQRDPGVFVI